jgi:hypothetical protein
VCPSRLGRSERHDCSHSVGSDRSHIALSEVWQFADTVCIVRYTLYHTIARLTHVLRGVPKGLLELPSDWLGSMGLRFLARCQLLRGIFANEGRLCAEKVGEQGYVDGRLSTAPGKRRRWVTIAQRCGGKGQRLSPTGAVKKHDRTPICRSENRHIARRLATTRRKCSCNTHKPDVVLPTLRKEIGDEPNQQPFAWKTPRSRRRAGRWCSHPITA